MEKENVTVGNKKRVVIPEGRNRGSSTHPPFCNKTTNDKRGRFPSPSRTGKLGNDANFISRCFNGGGFTLIELLVVVLIIGILASVALPQYNKAVEKSRATQALTMLKTVYDAANAYKLANGGWPSTFDELAVDVPWTGTTNGLNLGWAKQGKSNNDWSIQMRHGEDTIIVTRISGPYTGAAFLTNNKPELTQYSADELLCVEIKNSTDAVVPFSKTKGDYCQKIMKGTFISTGSSWDFFHMP